MVLARYSTWFLLLALARVDVLLVPNDVWTTLHSHTHTLEHHSPSDSARVCVWIEWSTPNTIPCNNQKERERKWSSMDDVPSSKSRTIRNIAKGMLHARELIILVRFSCKLDWFMHVNVIDHISKHTSSSERCKQKERMSSKATRVVRWYSTYFDALFTAGARVRTSNTWRCIDEQQTASHLCWTELFPPTTTARLIDLCLAQHNTQTARRLSLLS